MFNPSATLITQCIKSLQAGYRHTYGDLKPAYAELIGQVATSVLWAIARSDALYHNIDHTIAVVLVGQEILRGKQLQESNVSCQSWAHFIISLLCHDIGYVKGVCRQDRIEQRTYATGINHQTIVIAPGATDASLTAFHVDRSKLFVIETLANQPLLDLAVINHNIELTRFPVPKDDLHQDIASDAGLARAADLIGQLSDPYYLEKIPALFYEFEEAGTNQTLGYRHPGDLRANYPAFFHTVVCPYIRPALHYLQATPKGEHTVISLYANLFKVEQEGMALVPSL
ncbi:MAG TPA: Npun_R2479 family HD domain-containing metalloprotein [Coleofasciculaceae cyanobacterium]